MEPYSEKEKINFLRRIKEFQDYIHQSLPVVTTFLLNYFLVWDGVIYCTEILGLLEWIEIRCDDSKFNYSNFIKTFCCIYKRTSK